MKFHVIVMEDPEAPGLYNAEVPALPGCHTWGESVKEAMENAKDAIETYLEASAVIGEPIPRVVADRMVSIP